MEPGESQQEATRPYLQARHKPQSSFSLCTCGHTGQNQKSVASLSANRHKSEPEVREPTALTAAHVNITEGGDCSCSDSPGAAIKEGRSFTHTRTHTHAVNFTALCQNPLEGHSPSESGSWGSR